MCLDPTMMRRIQRGYDGPSMIDFMKGTVGSIDCLLHSTTPGSEFAGIRPIQIDGTIESVNWVCHGDGTRKKLWNRIVGAFWGIVEGVFSGI